MAAIVHVKANVVLLRDLLAARAEHAHVRTTEAVDALLGITNRGKVPRAVTGQKRDELELAGVGVLRLVDHHELEAPAVVCRNNGVVAHGMEGECDEVIVIQDGLLALELEVALVNLTG